MPLGTGELLFIVVLVLVLFGPDKLPELARGFGKGMREIRKITAEFQSQLNVLADLEDEKPKPPRARRPVERPRTPTSATAPGETPWDDSDSVDSADFSSSNDSPESARRKNEAHNDQPSLF